MKNNLYLCGEIVWGNCQMNGEVPTPSHHLSVHDLINGTMNKLEINEGDRFGRLVIIKEVFHNTRIFVRKFLCRCDCGGEVEVELASLTHGNTKSCGCYRRELAQKKKYIEPEIIINKKFGRLTVIEEISPHITSSITYRMFKCRCDCGNILNIKMVLLNNGGVQSCGCLKRERILESITTHGLTSHPLYRVWNGMKSRCNNKNIFHYENYGGRGIKVCQDWEDNFLSFYNWAISNGYEQGLEIDRIDNNRNYEPQNCRWTTDVVQANNRRSNTHYMINGVSYTLPDICRIYGVYDKCSVIRGRLRLGWSLKRAINY